MVDRRAQGSRLSRFLPAFDSTARGHVIAALSVAAITSVVFSPTLLLGYIKIDDQIYVSENPRVQAGLTLSNLRWALTTTEGSYWHPVTWVSFLTDSSLFGTSPAAMHRTSLILHSANATLLCLVLAYAGAPPLAAAVGAVLFAVHPLRIESVAWVSERKGLLCAFFLLLAILTQIIEERRRRRLALVSLYFGLAIMSKPTAIVLPALLLCLDFWPLDRWRRVGPLRCAVDKWPLWLLSAAFIARTLITEGQNIFVLGFIPLNDRLQIGVIEIGRVLKETIAPSWKANWISFIGVDPTVPIPLWKAVASLSAVIAITAAVVKSRRRAPWAAAGWFWFLMALLPTLGFLRFTPGAAGDRFTYLAHLGLALVFAGAVTQIFPRRKEGRNLFAFGSGAAILLLSVISWSNLGPWRDMASFAARAEEVDPKNSWAYNSLGVEFASAWKLDDALAQLDRAVALRPDYFQAWNNRGVTLAYLGRNDDSIKSFDRSLALINDGRVLYNREAVKMVRAHPDYHGDPLKLVLIHGVDLGTHQPRIEWISPDHAHVDKNKLDLGLGAKPSR